MKKTLDCFLHSMKGRESRRRSWVVQRVSEEREKKWKRPVVPARQVKTASQPPRTRKGEHCTREINRKPSGKKNIVKGLRGPGQCC